MRISQKKDLEGLGEELLLEAISYIKTVQNYVGGCLVYLDCKDNLIDYYKEMGFSFIQQRKKPDKNGDFLNQMYILI